MKKLCLMLALLMILLCGCDGAVAPAGSTPTETEGTVAANTEGTENTESTEKPTTETTGTQEPIGKREIPKLEDVTNQIPAYTGEQKVPYDPDWTAYFSAANIEMDLYKECPFHGFSVTIITKDYYNTESIQVNVPAKTAYEIAVTNAAPPDDLGPDVSWDGPPKFKDYHYLSLQGIDWQEYAQIREDFYAINSIIDDYFVELVQTNRLDEYTAYKQKYLNLRDNYKAQYEALGDVSAPFYVYSVEIRFNGIGTYDETIETVEFVLGNERYTVDIGQVRLHTECPEVLKEGRSSENVVYALNTFVGSQFNGGYYALRNDDAFEFVAEKDMTVTGIRQLGVEVGLLGAQVSISGSTVADYFWDLQRPLEIQKGDKVSISLYIKDDKFSQYEMTITTYIILDYEINGKAFTKCMPCKFRRYNNYGWDVYLMLEKNYDIGQYYACFYGTKHDYWLSELPEEWLQ